MGALELRPRAGVIKNTKTMPYNCWWGYSHREVQK